MPRPLSPHIRPLPPSLQESERLLREGVCEALGALLRRMSRPKSTSPVFTGVPGSGNDGGHATGDLVSGGRNSGMGTGDHRGSFRASNEFSVVEREMVMAVAERLWLSHS